MKKNVNISRDDLVGNLSEVLEKVQQGACFTIVQAGEPVATLRPFEQSSPIHIGDWRAKL